MPELDYMWYGTKPEIAFTAATTTQTEDFETFPATELFLTVTNPSTMAGTNAGWMGAGNLAFSGTKSIRSQPMVSVAGTHQYARIDLVFTIPSFARNVKIQYWYYQDSEVGFDGLKVYFNGSLVHNYITSGTYGQWTLGEITTSQRGQCTLTFEYDKDGQTDGGGTDAVYIDDLTVSWDVDTIGETPGQELVRFDGTTGYSLLYHRVGACAPSISFSEQRIPFQPGSIYMNTDIQPRDVELGVLIEGASKSDLRDKVRNLTNKIINVDGCLFAKYDNGSERRLYCRYSGGLEGDETPSSMGAGYFQKVVLTFRAFDPFWYEPLRISSQSTQNFVSSLINDGAWPAYPLIYVDGSSSIIDVAVWVTGGSEPDEGTSPRVKINTSIPTGRKLVIDTRKRTVKLDDGTNLYSFIDSVANSFPSIPNTGTAYTIDVDIDGTEANGRYHVYILKPHWGV
jgi:hypothetical protein